jgi:hypothetical protein
MAALDEAREVSHVQSLFDQLRFVFPKWRLPFVFEQLDSTLAALGEESEDLLTLRLRRQRLLAATLRTPRFNSATEQISGFPGAKGLRHRLVENRHHVSHHRIETTGFLEQSFRK